MTATIVFDLDGTLIGSAPDMHHAPNVLLAENGRNQVTPHQTHSFAGQGPGPLIRKAGAATGAAADEDQIPGLTARLGGSVGTVIMTGNSRTDVQAVRNAGVKVIVVTFGCEIEGLGADRVISSLADVPSAIAELPA